MSLFLKRQLYCCVMKSRCQKAFQRLEKKLRKIAQRRCSLTLPELICSPLPTLMLHVLSLCFNSRAQSLGAPACAVRTHPPLPPHRHVTSGEPLPSSGKFPLVQLAANSPSFWGEVASQMWRETHLKEWSVRHSQAQEMHSRDAHRALATRALPAVLPAPHMGFRQPPQQRSSSSSLLCKHSRGQGRSQDSPTKRKGLAPHRMYRSRLALASGSITGLHRWVTSSFFKSV